MSFAVERGSPVKSQLHLDSILDSVINNGGSKAKSREGVNLVELIYYCFRTNPQIIHSINAATGEEFTNEKILRRAVSIARALKSKGVIERVIIMLRNTEHMSALFYAVLMAGVVPFMVEPRSTEYEIQQFLPIVTPHVIFCEADQASTVSNAVAGSAIKVVVADGPSLDRFVDGFSDDIDNFQLPEAEPDSTCFILPTSGSTGVPKAALLSHGGIIIQMPSLWSSYSQFPRPTGLALLTSTGQWLTHTIIMTSFPVYQVPILMTPLKITAEYLAELVDKYRVTWAFLGPSIAVQLGQLATTEQLLSFDRLYIGGSPFSPDMLADLTNKLPVPCPLLNGYGMTECHGFVTGGPVGTPLTSVGKICNIFQYKLINDEGKIAKEPYEKGELYLKGRSIFKGYLNNEAAYHESITPDGWLRTGDILYRNEDDQMFFVNRAKLSFKYLNHHIYPEEIERVVGSVPGVVQCVVVGTDAGPAAAVLRTGDVAREDIQKAVSSTLSEYKHLRGGIAFVTSLPTTHTGKVHRPGCLQLIQELVSKGECF